MPRSTTKSTGRATRCYSSRRGGLRSQLEFWRHSPSNPAAPPPWMNPMVDLAGRFTVIGMDQRNAGNSRGTVTSTQWLAYLCQRSPGADGPPGPSSLPRHGRLHRRHLLPDAVRDGARAGHRRRAAEPDRPAREPGHLGRSGQRLRQDHAGERFDADRRDHPEIRPQHVRRRLRLLGEPRVRASLSHAALAAAWHRQTAPGRDQCRDRPDGPQSRDPEGLAQSHASRRVDPPGHRLPDPQHAFVMNDALTAQTVELLRQLIRNQCVNDGTVASGQEARTSDVLRAYLEGSGLDLEVYEPDGAPGRTSLVARIEGTDPAAPTLCLMGR